MPGTTTLQDEEPLPVLTARGYRIPSDFVGGISDGKNGIAVLDYNRLGLSAKKSWFMFGVKIVCLGAGIESDENLPVTTSVNQVYLNGEVDFKKESENYRWILHDNIGYFFPIPSKMTLKTDVVQGRWTDVTKLLSDELLSEEIFKLYFEHGINPKNESYGYILVPRAAKSVLEEMESELPFDIRNKTDIQEVIAKDGSVAGVIFYQPGKSGIFGGIETNKPCLVMLKKQEDGVKLSVADPTQKLKELTLVLESEYSGENAVSKNGKTDINLLLPQNEEAGQQDWCLNQR